MPSTMNESVQTPSDRFVKWLKYFGEVLQEYDKNNTNTTAGPEDEPCESAQARKALCKELLAFGHAFTHMLLRDQASAVTRFQVGVAIRHSESKEFTSEPYKLIATNTEILEAEFTQPFLAEVFKLFWCHVEEAKVESAALRELKRATTYLDPDPWPELRWPSSKDLPLPPNRNWTTWKHRDGFCSVCGESACSPYHNCYYCNDKPCYHHGQCCPNRTWGRRRCQGKGSAAAPSDSAAPATGGL